MILTPILVMLVFLAVQAALYFHAANVASAAAAQGAAAGSRLRSDRDVAAQVANQTVRELGSHSASDPSVQLSPNEVAVTVEIAVSQIVPFFPESVSRTAREPREQFIAEPDR